MPIKAIILLLENNLTEECVLAMVVKYWYLYVFLLRYFILFEEVSYIYLKSSEVITFPVKLFSTNLLESVRANILLPEEG